MPKYNHYWGLLFRDEIISIIALLSGESILIHPMTRRDEAREAHKKFLSSCGDHITLLNVFRNFKKVSQQKVSCHRLNYSALFSPLRHTFLRCIFPTAMVPRKLPSL